MQMDIDKQMLEVELRTTKENLQRAKQRIKDMRSKLGTSENSRIEMKVEMERMERHLKRMTSQESMKRQSLESATKDIELQALRRSNGRLKRRVTQLEEMNTSSRWRSGSFSLSRSSFPLTPTVPAGSFDYDSGCWSSISPSNSVESLETTDSNFDDASSTYSGMASTAGSHYTTGLYSQLEQLRGEISEARQKEREARQELQKLEQESKRKVQDLTLDVRAGQAENQSILFKTQALENHSKELQAAMDDCRCEDLEERLEELSFQCSDLQEERDAAEARARELQERLTAVNVPEGVDCETQTEAHPPSTPSSSPSSSPSTIAGRFVEKDAELKQFKAENRRLRLQLQVKEEDGRHVREEKAQENRRAGILDDYWTGSTISLATSNGTHNDKVRHVDRKQARYQGGAVWSRGSPQIPCIHAMTFEPSIKIVYESMGLTCISLVCHAFGCTCMPMFRCTIESSAI